MSNSKPKPETLLARYFTHLLSKNWSQNTVDRRQSSLGRFIAWCHERGVDEVDEITESTVEAYRRYLFHHRSEKTGKPLKFATQGSYLSAIRHWCEWLSNENWIKTNPAADIELPQSEQRLPASHLSESEAESLINAADVATPIGLRDRSIMETFYSTGMRRAELVNLNLDDIDTERRLLTIRQGKGRKVRVVPKCRSAESSNSSNRCKTCGDSGSSGLIAVDGSGDCCISVQTKCRPLFLNVTWRIFV